MHALQIHPFQQRPGSAEAVPAPVRANVADIAIAARVMRIFFMAHTMAYTSYRCVPRFLPSVTRCAWHGAHQPA
jgi:hypothetical protein